MQDLAVGDGGKFVDDRKIRLTFKFNGADKVFTTSRLHPSHDPFIKFFRVTDHIREQPVNTTVLRLELFRQ